MSIYSYTVKMANQKEVSLSHYENKVVLIVNTASECGLAPQLEGLQKLHKKYKSEGFTILGFPSNQFMNQEPLADGEIAEFCSAKYGVDFPLFSKRNWWQKDKVELYEIFDWSRWTDY